MEKTIAENNFISVYTEEDILYLNYQPDIEIDWAQAIKVMEFLEDFCGENNYLILEDMNNIKWIDKRSRDYFAQHPLNQKMKGWAYFSNQPIHKIMYTIYETFSKPRGNTAFFTNKEEALSWLSGFRNESLRL